VNRDRIYPIDEICSKIKQAPNLKSVFTVNAIALPETGLAYRVANEMRSSINPTQFRKFYDLVKSAKDISKESFEKGREKLYSLVPQVAYSVGRNLCDKNLFKLIKEAIVPAKIQDKKDIEAFADFFEAMVAYRKFIDKEGKR
jgi:CRISPR type III-A-associated protein Csm2